MMHIKRLWNSVLLLLLWMVPLSAQNISVESFRLLENDLTANTNGTMEYDQNGNVAALIKVVTSETGFVFDGGMLGIVKTVQKTGEIWVYVPAGLQRITISHQRLGVLRDHYFNIPVEKARTYELKLVTGRVRTIVEDEQTTQFLVLKVDPPTASVFLDGRIQSLKSDGTVSALVEFGKHEYRVEAAGYITEAGTIEVGREKVSKDIVLKSSKAELNLFVDNDNAEIWLNGEKVGIGSWSGRVAPGKYVAEARLEHHRNRSITFDVSEQEVINKSLITPEPMYGFIQFDCDPVETTIYLDGTVVGVTPLILNNVLEGEHTVRFEKKGYHSYETSVVVEEGKRSEFSVSLSDFFTASITSRPTGATVKINGENRGVTPLETEMSSGDYRINIQRFGYKPFDSMVHLDATDSELSVNLPRQYFKRSGFYLAGLTDIMPPLGNNINVGGALGFFIGGFNIEGSYFVELDAKEMSQVYFISGQQDKSSKLVYYSANSSIGAKLGYGMLVGHRMRLTPQVGATCLSIKGEDKSESYLVSTDVALTVELALVNHVALYVSPYYSIPVKKGELFESISNVSSLASKYRNGFGVSGGLSLYF